MKIVTVVGARPQFIKAAPVSRALRGPHHEVLVHTGQHYDHEMSGSFFEQLGIPEPDYKLEVGSAGHGAQTGRMLERIESVLVDERPDAVLVYGDTNSTLAGALAAAKLHIPIVHVEAGLRSFDMRMPEELNRILTDRISALLLCPSNVAASHLNNEGISRGVHVIGDVMLDALLEARDRCDAGPLLTKLDVRPKEYILATIHRAENTDDSTRLREIVGALGQIDRSVVLPLHPRTRSALCAAGVELPCNVRAIAPLGYLDLVAMLSNASYVLTDSGGLQKEAYWLGVPCVTLRETTEWTETVDAGWNTLVGADRCAILAAARQARVPCTANDAYGTRGASVRVVSAIELLQ